MRVGLVTGQDGPSFTQQVDVPLVAALEARGVEVVRPAWDDASVAWQDLDAAVVRTTWDYTSRRDEFVAWARHAGELTAVFNPPEVLRWNTHKSYLLELEDRGAPTVPTAWIGRGDTIDLGGLLAARGWRRAVVKPAVASGSDRLVRVDLQDPRALEGAQEHLEALLENDDALVQPYLSAVETRGELSIVVIDGQPSHAVRKLPQPGEFRVQRRFGGRYRAEPIDPETSALAAWIVESTGTQLLQARVDLLADDAGAWQLTELEVTEPDLYLDAVPTAAATMAEAIMRRIDGG